MRKQSHKKIGLPPGSLVHVGRRKIDRPEVSLIDYTVEKLTEEPVRKVEETFSCRERPSVSWLNVDGIHDIALLRKIGEGFGLHSLTLEDILDTEHRPKYEDYDDYLFVVVKMLSFDEEEGRIQAEQVSLVLGPNFVLSFQEESGDVFEVVRMRLRAGKGRIRESGADYLAYALLDAVVDSYFGILEQIGDRIEDLEEELIECPATRTLEKIHRFKREMIEVRRSVWPLREIISRLQRQESPLVKPSTAVFLRDVYDHTIQVIDTAETFRDIIAGMLDIYLSSLSNRMNEVMKILTIIATIFIPLTFIVGVYGMNFEVMPELEWRWGYHAVWVVMIVISLGMLIFFRRKKWL